MMNEFDHPKLWIVNYYGSLINEIDIRCEAIFSNFLDQKIEGINETEIQNNLNGIRAQFIDEINAIQTKNLSQFENVSQETFKKFEQLDSIENSNIKSLIIDELKRKLFSEYCFLITNNLDFMMHTYRSTKLGLKLVVCDWYLSENQIEYLRKLWSNSIHEVLINEEGLKLKFIIEKISKNPNELVIKINEKDFYSQTVLDFNYKRVKQIKDDDSSPFKIFSNLTILNLNGTSILSLNKNLFENLSKLEKLDLSFNKISLLNSCQFLGLHLLTILNLSFSSIEKLNKNLFNELINLEELYLQTNLIKKLDENLFSNLKSLKVLKLWNNRIEYLNPKTFNGLKNLFDLDINSNLIRKIERDVFFGLFSLKRLDLHNNRIELIERNAFSIDLTRLEELNLQGNEIRSINMSTFDKLIYLKYLRLNKNKVVRLKAYNFGNMCYLKEVHLNQNLIKCLRKNDFFNMISVKLINLSENKIQNIDDQTFDGLNMLTDLKLNNNPLKFIDIKLKKKLEKLYKIVF